MTHKGEKVEQIMRQLGISKKDLASKLGVSRNTIFKWLKDPDLTYEKIKRIGDAIDYDFSMLFPDYPYVTRTKHLMLHVNEPESEYTGLEACQRELEELKEKYYGMLEKYNELIEMFVLNNRKKLE